jgi:hypothetical protein
MGRRCDGRSRSWTGARWLAHRGLQLALCLLHQPADRRPRLARHDDFSARGRTERHGETGLVRFRHLEPDDRRTAGHVGPWRATRLVRLWRDRHRGHHRCLGTLLVPRAHLHRAATLREAIAVPRSQLHCRDYFHRHRRAHLLRLPGAARPISKFS